MNPSTRCLGPWGTSVLARYTICDLLTAAQEYRIRDHMCVPILFAVSAVCDFDFYTGIPSSTVVITCDCAVGCIEHVLLRESSLDVLHPRSISF